MEIQNNKKTLMFPIEFFVLSSALFLKIYSLNKKLDYGKLTFAISMFTVLIFAVIYAAVFFISKKNTMGFAFAVYAVLSVIIFIDILYFGYFSKLPSVASLSSAKYLTGVTDSIMKLITAERLAYIIDVPLIIVYFANYRKNLIKKSYDKGIFKIRTELIVGVCISAAMIPVIIMCIVYGFRARYFKNELITFHISDIYNVYFNKNSGFDINDDDYQSAVKNADKDDYYGIANGRNVITVQVEALQGFVIGMECEGQEITPNLNNLIENDTIYFENYYYMVGGGNTADAEFAVNNSLYSPDTEAAYVKYCDNDYHGLPYILKDNGYSGAYAFHAYFGDYWNREAAYVKQGFDYFTSKEDFTEDDIVGMGISDDSFFRQSVEIMKTYEQPFYSFLITLSSHYPYEIPSEFHELKLSEELEGTYVGNYLQTIHYVDRCIGLFFDYLKEAGLYDNSIISIYGDHFGVLNDSANNAVMTKLLGAYYEDVLFRVPLIMHIPNSGCTSRISTVASHIDFLPTMLHLLGYENSQSVMFGHDIFTTPDNVVYEQMHVSRGSFATKDIFFVYPRNGIYENIKIFDKSTDEIVEMKDEYDKIAQDAINTYNKCMYILDNNMVVKKNNE